jgi:hypothetical protein
MIGSRAGQWMKWRKRTLDEVASMICGGAGNCSVGEPFFQYRSSSYLTRFFSGCRHRIHTSGRITRMVGCRGLEKILAEPHTDALTPPPEFCRVIQILMDPADATGEDSERKGALESSPAFMPRRDERLTLVALWSVVFRRPRKHAESWRGTDGRLEKGHRMARSPGCGGESARYKNKLALANIGNAMRAFCLHKHGVDSISFRDLDWHR